jgi:hypothetical protein
MPNQPTAGRDLIDKFKGAVKDAKFVSRLKADPAAALLEVGIEVPKGGKADFDKVTQRATEDPQYRSRLKAEPIVVLREAGIEVPPGVEVTVLDFDPNHRYLIIPASLSGK